MGTVSIWHLVMIFAIIMPAAVLIVLVLRVLWRFGTAPKPPTDRPPLDILKERFARGEIDKEELESRRRMIGELMCGSAAHMNVRKWLLAGVRSD